LLNCKNKYIFKTTLLNLKNIEKSEFFKVVKKNNIKTFIKIFSACSAVSIMYIENKKKIKSKMCALSTTLYNKENAMISLYLQIYILYTLIWEFSKVRNI
jgi:hypothetical protein